MTMDDAARTFPGAKIEPCEYNGQPHWRITITTWAPRFHRYWSGESCNEFYMPRTLEAANG